MLHVFELLYVYELITVLAVFALGFVLGRIWETRKQEVAQLNSGETGFRVPIAHLPDYY